MSQPPGVSRQILVVDDNVDSAVAFSVFLEHAGHRTRVAHDGIAALAVANEFRPDVILLDIGLPGMDGHETARAIRQQPWAKGADHHRHLRLGAGVGQATLRVMWESITIWSSPWIPVL